MRSRIRSVGGAPPLPHGFAPQGPKKVVKSLLDHRDPRILGKKGDFRPRPTGRREKSDRVRRPEGPPDGKGTEPSPGSPKEWSSGSDMTA